MKKHLVLTSLITGIVAAAVTWSVDALLAAAGIPWLRTAGNGIVVGFLGALLTYQLLLRNRVIDEVNDHVRNALTVIIHTDSADDLRESMKQIDWTLKNSLRGKLGRRKAPR